MPVARAGDLRTHATLLPGGARGSEQERAPSRLRGTRTGARAHGQTAVSAGLPPELYVFVSKIWFVHQCLWGPGAHVTEPFPGILLPPTCAAWLFSAPPPSPHPPELKPGQSGVAPQSRVCVFACGSPVPCVWPGRALSGLQLAAAVGETAGSGIPVSGVGGWDESVSLRSLVGATRPPGACAPPG